MSNEVGLRQKVRTLSVVLFFGIIVVGAITERTVTKGIAAGLLVGGVVLIIGLIISLAIPASTGKETNKHGQ